MIRTGTGTDLAVYIHFAFCRAPRCSYCDFYSTDECVERIARWTEAVARECDHALRSRFDESWTVSTVFFGGGTPSLLDPESLGMLLDVVAGCWEVADDAEISLECNPVDIKPGWAARCREAGFNRLSVGVQSFDQDYVESMGRCDRGDPGRALESARNAGFDRISADLILGGPGSSEELIRRDVRRALDAGVEHLSVYGYRLEPPAPGFGMEQFEPVEEDSWSAQYLAVCELLERNGWRHYEISNWAAGDSAVCRHNLAYWHRRPYLGLGPSAHSYGPGEVRTSSRPDLDAWLAAAEHRDFSAVERIEPLEEDTVMFERVMLGLRLDTGVDLELLRRIHGPVLEELVELLRIAGMVRIDRNRLVLTDRGLLMYDSVACELLPEVKNAG